MSCKCYNDKTLDDLRNYLKEQCVCNFLINVVGNCENCLKFDNYCKCSVDYIFDSENIKEALTCPIGFKVFFDPVTASDGYVYERSNIVNWFIDNNTSPMTGLEVESKDLYPNYVIKSILKNCKKIYKVI